MIEQIVLENFKGIRDRVELALRPITLFYGPNSSGKTSIMQSLLLLKQSYNAPKYIYEALAPVGDHVDLGSYREMVHRHNPSRRLVIGLTIGDQLGEKPITVEHKYRLGSNSSVVLKRCVFRDPSTNRRLIELASPKTQAEYPYWLEGNWVNSDLPASEWKRLKERFGHERRFRDDCRKQIQDKIMFQFSSAEDRRRRPERKRPESRKPWTPQDVARWIWNDFLADEDENDGYSRYMELTAGSISTEHGLPEVLRAYDSITQQYDSYSLKKFVQDYRSYARAHVFLLKRSRIDDYHLNHENDPSVVFKDLYGIDLRGAGAAAGDDEHKGPTEIRDLVLSSSARIAETLDHLAHVPPIRANPKRFTIVSDTYLDLIPVINRWLTRFGSEYELDTYEIPSPDAGRLPALCLRDKRLGVHVNPAAVGFGISQILPLIEECLLSEFGEHEDRTLCIEQPEAQIHPRLQAEVGSLLAECIESGCQFLVETHSEHLLLRLQRLIRRGELDHKKLAVYYVDKDDRQSFIQELRIDRDGEMLDPWPDGFFSEGFEERFGE